MSEARLQVSKVTVEHATIREGLLAEVEDLDPYNEQNSFGVELVQVTYRTQYDDCLPTEEALVRDYALHLIRTAA